MTASHPVALVTGAARRVGAAIVRCLHDAGYDIALHHRDSAQQASLLQAELERARPGSTLVLQAELAHFDRLPELVAATVGRFGRLDALVNNASAFYATPIGTTPAAAWDDLFAANARAPFFLAQAANPHLQASEGSIVNLLDIYVERPLREHTLYLMAKSALATMTLSLARELAPRVRVNGVAPGAVLWPEQGKSQAERDSMLAGIPLRRMGAPGDVAEAVRWLLLDARYTTGQIIRVDGGRSLAI